MACATKVMRVHLPAHERDFLLQPENFDSNFSYRNLKSLDGDLDMNKGAPR